MLMPNKKVLCNIPKTEFLSKKKKNLSPRNAKGALKIEMNKDKILLCLFILKGKRGNPK